MPAFQPVRGTHDLLPDEQRKHLHVIDTARQVARGYGYAEMSTPIFEFTEVFARSMGETSDVVSKEMYSFVDKGGENLTLRPEYTAGICRAFISNGLAQQAPFKVFAHGPMFRFERPQKGRQRQFHQIDVEVIGAPEPEADIEVVTLAADILERLGLLDKCVLEINSLGDLDSRLAYRRALVEYLEGHRAHLSEDSLKRLERNPLRILDSKDAGDREVIAGAPPMEAFYTAAARDFFAAVRAGLDASGVAYQLSPRLVRGLDYYTHTAFEFVTTHLGAQGTLIGGGRYDGLIEMLGGQPTAGIGWAGGIERLAMLAANLPPPVRPVALIPIGPAAEARALDLARALRREGLVIELGFRGNVGRRMKRANRLNAIAAVILGDDELAKGVVALRELDSGSQSELPIERLAEKLRTLA
ncbi:MAG: histidine--tRNA ligase [Alphaproteobacteria bacterium]|nr:histidine--tRNA ligase [Alphaproteobacteria bacterium]